MLVVTPNTCIDVTTWLSALVPGSVSRATRTEVTAGGKGVNVCRTLRALGDSPRLIGLSPASDPRLADLLAAEGCDFLPVPQSGQSRLALILLEDAGRVTVVNGRGPEPHQWDHDELLATIAEQVETTRPAAVLCSGSLPPTCRPPSTPTSSRPPTTAASPRTSTPPPPCSAPPSPAGPTWSAPTSARSSRCCSAAPTRTSRRRATTSSTAASRPPASCTPAAPAAPSSPPAPTAPPSPPPTAPGGSTRSRVPVANPIGAGDSFLAGTAHALATGADDVTAVRHGMAVAAAAVQHERGGMLDASLVDGILQRMSQGVPA